MSYPYGRPLAWLLPLFLLGCGGSSPHISAGWQRVFPSFSAPVHELVDDPGDPGVVYAACGWQLTGRETDRVGGVLRSTDDGETWVPANQGIPRATEVLSLALAPRGAVHDEDPSRAHTKGPGTLLAGTRGKGIYVSTSGGAHWRALTDGSGGIDWRRLSVRALVTVPGEPTTLFAGTQGHGVLSSEDGGLTWEFRNQGLLSLTIQGLTVDGDGTIWAGTWYGGVYRSDDRGLSWAPIHRDYRRIAVASLAVADDGVLWIGLQNGGLYAVDQKAGSPSPDLAPQGESVILGDSVLAIDTWADEVLIGLGGRGAAVGRRDGRFWTVDGGLTNPTVSAVFFNGEQPGKIIIGTWEGLYRSIPPPSRWVARILATGVLGMVLLVSALLWRRSVSAASRALYHGLEGLDPEQISTYYIEELAKLPQERTPEILDSLAARMARSGDQVLEWKAEVLAGTAGVLRTLRAAKTEDIGAKRLGVAEALHRRSELFESLTANLVTHEKGERVAAATLCMALQDSLLARFLEADSLGHVAALRVDFLELQTLTGDPKVAPWVTSKVEGALRPILDIVDQLGRLPSPEDRALYLGQALSQTLAAQDTLSRQRSSESTRLRIGEVVLESLRELLSTALQDVNHRAYLKVALRSKKLTTKREAVIVLELKNDGQGHARNIAVELQQNKDEQRLFRVLRGRCELRGLLREQSALLEFTVEPLVSDKVRLRFRIFYDDLEREGHRSEFADEVTFQQIEEVRVFRPLRPNPYVVGRPLLQTDIFLGRSDLFERLKSSLRGANQDNVVVLIGARRMGKTSILRRLHGQLEDDYVPVLIDLQGMIGSGEPAFFRELTATICDELEELGIAVVEPAAETFDRDPGVVFRRQFLREVCRSLGQRRLLLMFDEFEVLEARIQKGDLDPRILPFFRSMMQHEQSVSFIFAGTHRLDELTHDYWGVLFNLAIYLDVGHLSELEAKRLFVGPTAELFDVDPLALDKTFQLTGGHPHLSQLLAREIVEYRNHRKLSYLTIQDVNSVADQVVEKGQLHISYLWDEGSRGQQVFLLAMKELLDRNGIATLSAIDQYLGRHRIESGDLVLALRQLIRREILIDNAGMLSFGLGLLRLWLDRNHNLESFLLSEGKDLES